MSRSDSPIKTRKGGALIREVGPEPLKWMDRADFESEWHRRLRRDEAEPRPAIAGEPSRYPLAVRAAPATRPSSEPSPIRRQSATSKPADDSDGKHSSRRGRARFVFGCEFIVIDSTTMLGEAGKAAWPRYGTRDLVAVHSASRTGDLSARP